jgi:hypothetical protein
MRLIDYYNKEFIADLAIVENQAFYCSLKNIYSGLGGNFSRRAEELDDERLINFIFSSNALFFIDQTISYYLSPFYQDFLKKYDFSSSLKDRRILDCQFWFRTEEIKERLKNKYRVKEGRYSTLTVPAPVNILDKFLKKIMLKKLDESGEVIVNELKKIEKLLEFKNFFDAMISVIACDGDLKKYIDHNINWSGFNKVLLKSFWAELYKLKIIDHNKFYFLNSIFEKFIFRSGSPLVKESFEKNKILSEDEFFLSEYKAYLNFRNNNFIY